MRNLRYKLLCRHGKFPPASGSALPTQCRPAPATAYGSGTGSAVPDKNAKSLQGARGTASAPHFAEATYASWGRKARAGRAHGGLGQRANGNRDAPDATPAAPKAAAWLSSSFLFETGCAP